MAAIGDPASAFSGPGSALDGPAASRDNDLPPPPPNAGQNGDHDAAYKQSIRQVLSSDVN